MKQSRREFLKAAAGLVVGAPLVGAQSPPAVQEFMGTEWRVSTERFPLPESTLSSSEFPWCVLSRRLSESELRKEPEPGAVWTQEDHQKAAIIGDNKFVCTLLFNNQELTSVYTVERYAMFDVLAQGVLTLAADYSLYREVPTRDWMDYVIKTSPCVSYLFEHTAEILHKCGWFPLVVSEYLNEMHMPAGQPAAPLTMHAMLYGSAGCGLPGRPVILSAILRDPFGNRLARRLMDWGLDEALADMKVPALGE